jgi:hypothetical protein
MPARHDACKEEGNKMILKNSVKAAVAAAALTFSISGAQAQTVVPPVFSAPVTVLPYGGYYGPSITVSPSITVGAPFYSPSLGAFGNGGYGYSNYDTNGFGYGSYGFNSYNAFDTTIGNVEGAGRGDHTVNPMEVEGGLIDATAPNAVLNPNAAPDAANPVPPATANQRKSAPTGATRSLVTVRRGPYNRVDIAYRGDVSNVSSITMMLLDRRGREVQQDVLTAAPAETLLRRSVGAQYYRVIVNYNDGTSRTYTHALYAK